MKSDERQATAEEAYSRALNYELEYGCCPQCVLATVQELVGNVTDETIKASHGLSGGGGLTGQGTCGALTGGLMALSAKKGRDRDKLDKGKFINNFNKGRELTEKFQQEFGGIRCDELQKQFTGRTYDMWNASEYQQFDRDRGNQCAHATGMVTKWVIEML
ncbi:MAG: C-GCAxxG-C-C family protein [Candidatus Sedimenticola sp. PURPLELP]